RGRRARLQHRLTTLFPPSAGATPRRSSCFCPPISSEPSPLPLAPPEWPVLGHRGARWRRPRQDGQLARLGEDAARHAEEIKLTAQRKAGECLAKLQKGKGSQPKNHSSQAANSDSQYRKALKDADIDKN